MRARAWTGEWERRTTNRDAARCFLLTPHHHACYLTPVHIHRVCTITHDISDEMEKGEKEKGAGMLREHKCLPTSPSTSPTRPFARTWLDRNNAYSTHDVIIDRSMSPE
jgi:hypothetical protein